MPVLPSGLRTAPQPSVTLEPLWPFPSTPPAKTSQKRPPPTSSPQNPHNPAVHRQNAVFQWLEKQSTFFPTIGKLLQRRFPKQTPKSKENPTSVPRPSPDRSSIQGKPPAKTRQNRKWCDRICRLDRRERRTGVRAFSLLTGSFWEIHRVSQKSDMGRKEREGKNGNVAQKPEKQNARHDGIGDDWPAEQTWTETQDHEQGEGKNCQWIHGPSSHQMAMKQ